MALFRKRRDAEATDTGDHPAPVEIDLGFRQHPWEAEALIAGLAAEGVRVHLTAQSQIPEMSGGLGPKRCLVLVHPDDERRVQDELAVAGLL